MEEEKIKEAFLKIKQDIKGLRKDISKVKDKTEGKKDKKIIVVVSGYFDPIHKGHIEYLKKAKELGIS